MYNQNAQGGYQQQPYPQGQAQKAPRKDKVNEFTGIGIVRPLSNNENDTITFYPNKAKPGGHISFFLKITELTGTSDENGNPNASRVSIPVNVWTNKNITPQQLQGVISGMKVQIVGKVKLGVHENKQTGQKLSRLEVDAHVFKVLEMPMQGAQQYQAGPAGGQAPRYGQQQMPPQQGYQQPAPGYQPYPPQGGYAQPAPIPGPQGYYPAQQQMPPQKQPAQGYQQARPAGQQVPPPTIPPYYQPAPQQGYQQGPGVVMEDLPEGI